MPHYLFNLVGDGAPGQAAGRLRAGMWGIAADEPHRRALAAGDLALVYLGGPARELIGRVELASAVRGWTPSEAQAYPGDSTGGVLLAQVEQWSPPVPMSAVLAEMDSTQRARADFDAGVVRITSTEYETALVVASGRLTD